MVDAYEDNHYISLTIIKENSELPPGINTAFVEEQVPILEIRVHAVCLVDDDGVIFQTQQSSVN